MSHGTRTPPPPPEFGVADGFERETHVAPLLSEPNIFANTNGDCELEEVEDDRLVPLLDPRGHGLCPGWWCERCGAFCFFFTVCTASLIASAATMVVCIADTGSMVVVYSFLAPEFHILKPQTTFAYRFNHTLNDLVWSSWVRTFLALASHAASRRENVYFPYLLVSSILLVVCGIHASLKAVYFQYAEDEVDKTIAPLMFAITITACVAHVLVAASMRVHARKTLKRQAATRAGVLGFRFSESGALQGMDGSYGFDSQGDDGNLNSDGRRSPRGQQMMQSPLTPGFDFDADVPADRLIDRDSKFATIRGVRVHYKDSYEQGQTQNENEFDCSDDESWSGNTNTTRGGFFPPDAAVVFIHGFGAGAFAWRKVAPSLSRTLGVRCICVDRPGFGFSARPKRGEFSESQSPYDVVEQARIVLDLCSYLKVDRVLFAGHADGCLVVMRAAAEAEMMTPWSPETTVNNGDRFSGMSDIGDVKVDVGDTETESDGNLGNNEHTAGSFVTSISKPSRNNVRVAGIALLGADFRLDAAVPAPVRLLLNTKLGEKMLRPLLRTEIGEVANRRAWFDRSKLTRGTLRLYQKPLCIEGWDWALMEAARTRQKMTQRDVSVALQALADTPTLMVTGADDVVAPPTGAVAIAAELRRCALKILPRCGHLPHEESPRALLEALRPFVLETLQRGGGQKRDGFMGEGAQY